MAGRLNWSRTPFRIWGRQHLFSPPTSKQAMSRLASRVSDKLAWPRSRALNTGVEAAAADDVVAVELEQARVVVELAVLLYFKYDFSCNKDFSLSADLSLNQSRSTLIQTVYLLVELAHKWLAFEVDADKQEL